MNRICTICARGGSKGVPNKNIRLLLGKPLIAYSIQQAKQTGLFDCIAVSSDSQEILDIAKQYGADYQILRPKEMATDSSAKLPAIRHCVKEVERFTNCVFYEVVDLDATSPLRIPDDIISAIELNKPQSVSNVITGMPSRRSPYFNLVELNSEGYVTLSKKMATPVFRRQDAPKCYDMNASIYVWKRDVLMDTSTDSVFHDRTLLYEMPEERSIDIDSELDWKLVELILTERLKEKIS